uniref:Uncharacterized protein n=1 Tax=Ailuropoda melanoleuca TaxID=9646 RepID=A0A7N5KHI2_AILME
MAEEIKTKIKNYWTAPSESHFPNQNQTRNCWQNHVDFHHCEKIMNDKGEDKNHLKSHHITAAIF